MREIRKIGVLGTGVMGSQIAAHLVNAGFKVLMLDIVPTWMFNEEELKNPKNRNHLSLKGLEMAKGLSPAPFALPEFADLIEIGNFTDDFEKLKEVDWIIEAVKEDLGIKQDLMKRVAQVRQEGAIVSSNTSGISLKKIAEGLPEDFKQHFLGTHFFNPPRYLALLEITPLPETLPEVLNYLKDFCDKKLGKTVVLAKDTPGFIANRIGIVGVMNLIKVMLEEGYSIEEVDKITGKAIGWPSSATFRTLDIAGLNVFADVVNYLSQNLQDEKHRDLLVLPDFIKKMIENGWYGQKAKKGFYQKVGKEILVIDPQNLEYRPQQKVNFASLETAKNISDTAERIKFLVWGNDRVANFLQKTLIFTLTYAAEKVGEIADDIVTIDKAVKNGFLWELGPFEIWDALSVQKIIEKLKESGQQIPVLVEELLNSGNQSFYQRKEGKTFFFDFKQKDYKELDLPEGIIILKDLKEQNKILKQNNEASLIDLGDGVACLEFHSKMNAIGAGIIKMMKITIKEITENKNFQGLVIANQGEHFSVGANLDLVKEAILNEEWDELELMIREFQNANMGFKYMPKPVVAAPFGYTLGGGCEICLHADKICASLETYIGLVEVGVGVIPAAGGTKEILLRNLQQIPENMPVGIEVDPLPYLQRALETIGLAKVATSAFEAKKLGYLKQDDVIVMQKQRLIDEAKKLVLTLARNYQPPKPKKITLYGERIYSTLKLGLHLMRKGNYISDYDEVVAGKLVEVLTGGNLSRPVEVPEQYLLDKEREIFLFLCRQKKTQERIAYMLKTGKPLRN